MNVEDFLFRRFFDRDGDTNISRLGTNLVCESSHRHSHRPSIQHNV